MADLCTVEELKAWLDVKEELDENGDPIPFEDDVLLGAIITSESARICRFMNRKNILAANYSEVFSGNGKSTQLIPTYPIISITKLTINGQEIEQYMYGGTSGFTFSEARIRLVNKTFHEGVDNCFIEYRAGYEEIPEDIKQACLELCAFRYQERQRIGHSSKSLNGETVSFITKEMPDSVKQKLQNYVRTFPSTWGL